MENEKEEPEVEVLDFTKPDYAFVPGTNHDYRQHGPYLVCKSCELEHAIFIGIDKLLTGFDENGQPIIKLRV